MREIKEFEDVRSGRSRFDRIGYYDAMMAYYLARDTALPAPLLRDYSLQGVPDLLHIFEKNSINSFYLADTSPEGLLTLQILGCKLGGRRVLRAKIGNQPMEIPVLEIIIN